MWSLLTQPAFLVVCIVVGAALLVTGVVKRIHDMTRCVVGGSGPWATLMVVVGAAVSAWGLVLTLQQHSHSHAQSSPATLKTVEKRYGLTRANFPNGGPTVNGTVLVSRGKAVAACKTFDDPTRLFCPSKTGRYVELPWQQSQNAPERSMTVPLPGNDRPPRG